MGGLKKKNHRQNKKVKNLTSFAPLLQRTQFFNPPPLFLHSPTPVYFLIFWIFFKFISGLVEKKVGVGWKGLNLCVVCVYLGGVGVGGGVRKDPEKKVMKILISRPLPPHCFLNQHPPAPSPLFFLQPLFSKNQHRGGGLEILNLSLFIFHSPIPSPHSNPPLFLPSL